MTAEIAVLNKLAVTLAADSAVTIRNPDGTKVYNSADKIFEATTHDPIGIMVYNNPELCGVPVEVIIKMFRDKHCPGHFPTVFEFSDAFLSHIEKLHLPETTVNAIVWSLINVRAFEIKDRLNNITDEFFKTATTEKFPTIDDLLAALEVKIIDLLDAEISTLDAVELPDWAKGLSKAKVLKKHGVKIKDYIDAIFNDGSLSDERRERIVSILALSMLKEFQRSNLTGLVFAGFGEKEIFPSLVSFEVYGTVAGKLKFERQAKFDVDRSLLPDAAAYPFAQREMVDRFMYGLDGEFVDLCNTYFSGALESLKGHLREKLEGLDDATKAALDPAVDTILQEFASRIVPDHVSRLQSQFSDMIRSMPKQELAALAESLVHITSLKRKFSAGAESVGGPIDVAMITRAEGFVWVKRKHYFDASLNPRYFFRRYGGSNRGPEPADLADAE